MPRVKSHADAQTCPRHSSSVGMPVQDGSNEHQQGGQVRLEQDPSKPASTCGVPFVDELLLVQLSLNRHNQHNTQQSSVLTPNARAHTHTGTPTCIFAMTCPKRACARAEPCAAAAEKKWAADRSS